MTDAENSMRQATTAGNDAEAAEARKDYAAEAAFANAMASFHIARALYQLVEQGKPQADPFHVKGGVPLMAPVVRGCPDCPHDQHYPGSCSAACACAARSS